MSIPFISSSHLFNRVNSCRSCSSGAMDHLCWRWRMVQCYWWTRSRWPMTRYWKDLTAFSNLKGRCFLPRKVVVHWTLGKMSIFLSLITIFELSEQWILEGTSARRRYAKNLHCFCFAFYANDATKRIFPIIFFIFVHISFCVICVPFYLQKWRKVLPNKRIPFLSE